LLHSRQEIDQAVSRPKLSPLWGSLLYLVLLIVFVEVALQGFYWSTAGDFLFRRTGVPIYARERHAGFGNRPGLSFDHRTNEFHARYYVNQAGFRVPRPELEYMLARPNNTYRVMILGPSFAYGWGVEYQQSFAGVLEQLLQERRFAGEMKIEIINAGVPAIPTGAQLAWFERVGKGYTPDLVVQLVYGSMAMPDISTLYADVDDNGYLVSISGYVAPRWYDSLKKLATVFYGWVLWSKLHSQDAPARTGEGNAVLGAGRGIFVPPEFDTAHPAVRQAMLVYTELAGSVRAAGARLLVVYVPLSYAIHREDEVRWRHLGVRDIARQTAFDAAFVRHLNECRIPSIDLTQNLRKSAEMGKRIYFWLDIHWTAAGNASAARAVADYLTGAPWARSSASATQWLLRQPTEPCS
jgi:acetyltransferase AlgX (SGNH hydrolase-like protein)